MSERGDVYDCNMDLARRIHLEVLRDPTSPYAGKWVGIANGQVVVVGDNYDDVCKRLDEIEPDQLRTFCTEGIGMTEEQMDDLWGVG